MPTFPHALCGIRLGGAETPAPVMLRSEVERGIARHRRTAADSLVSFSATLLFVSAQSSADFDTWFFSDCLAGAAWFDFTHPRTGLVVSARIVGGDIGGLTPLADRFRVAERSLVFEYVRQGFAVLPPGLHTVDPSRIMSVQRNSPATYVDGSGVLQTAAANVARWQGGQVLVEGESVNYVANSDFSTPDVLVGGGSTSHVAAVLPSGISAYASEYITTSINCVLRMGVYTGADPGSPHVGSVWARALLESVPVTVNCNDGPVVAATLGPFWQRIEASRAAFEPYAYAFVDVRIAAGAAGRRIQMCMAQVEPGTVATSYIPTTTAPATRAADIITVAA